MVVFPHLNIDIDGFSMVSPKLWVRWSTIGKPNVVPLLKIVELVNKKTHEISETSQPSETGDTQN